MKKEVAEVVLSAKEVCAQKRVLNATKSTSLFCRSTIKDSQAFRIDAALASMHTLRELFSLQSLKDCKENRIKSHISFLKHNFKNTCEFVSETRDKKVYFMFISK